MRTEHCCQVVLTLFSLGPSLSNQEAGRTIRIESEQHPDDGAGYRVSNFHFYRTQVRSLPSLVSQLRPAAQGRGGFLQCWSHLLPLHKKGRNTHTEVFLPKPSCPCPARTSRRVADHQPWLVVDIGQPRIGLAIQEASRLMREWEDKVWKGMRGPDSV